MENRWTAFSAVRSSLNQVQETGSQLQWAVWDWLHGQPCLSLVEASSEHAQKYSFPCVSAQPLHVGDVLHWIVVLTSTFLEPFLFPVDPVGWTWAWVDFSVEWVCERVSHRMCEEECRRVTLALNIPWMPWTSPGAVILHQCTYVYILPVWLRVLHWVQPDQLWQQD